MVAIVALIAGIGVLLLTIQVAVPQLRPNLALRPSEEDDSGKDVRYNDTKDKHELLYSLSYICIIRECLSTVLCILQGIIIQFTCQSTHVGGSVHTFIVSILDVITDSYFQLCLHCHTRIPNKPLSQASKLHSYEQWILIIHCMYDETKWTHLAIHMSPLRG